MLEDMMDKEKHFEDVMEKLKQFETVMGKIKPQEVKATPTTKDVVKNEKQEVSIKTKPYEWRTESIKGEGSVGCWLAILIVLVPLVYFIVTNLAVVIAWFIILSIIYKIIKSLFS
jgi:hypothetical protein